MEKCISTKLKSNFYDINPNEYWDEIIQLTFIKNDFELFFYNEKINLNLFAECIEKSNYTEDMLSFIVSEIQLRVPEFRCRGYLND